MSRGWLMAVALAWAVGCGDGGGDAAGGDAGHAEADAGAAADARVPVSDARQACPPAVPDAPTVCIASSSFTMGCTPADADCRFDELPAREVILSTFEIDRHETTQAAWAACVAAGECAEPTAAYTPETTPDAAVRGVTWMAAARYCAWRDMRLPSEAEWERAARGTGNRRYPWGNAPPDCDRAVFSDCAPVLDIAEHPAGVSAEGVAELAGGVWEYVGDRYAASYAGLATTDPQGPAEGATRVMRGGSFRTDPWALRARTRATASPSTPYDDAGVRCARTP